MTVTKRRSKTDAEAVQSSGLTIEPGEGCSSYARMLILMRPRLRHQIYLRLLCVPSEPVLAHSLNAQLHRRRRRHHRDGPHQVRIS